MAVRAAPTNDTGTTTRRTWLTAVALLALFVAALFLRAYWNMDAARDDEGNFVLSGGSDPYYHKRAVDAIQQDHDGDGKVFETLFYDPLLNYPHGAVNPNPPMYEWSVAVAGKLMEPFFAAEGNYSALQVSTWWAMEWSPAVFGALTVFPIFFIGSALFDRRAGLVAALLWTISTSAIDATGLGLADHDAAIMFFASLAFLFYIQALRQFRGDGHWVARWGDGAAVTSGLGRFFGSRRLGLAYAVLAGVAIGAVGLVWKGFPYVIGIMFVYAVLQMVVDHWRNRDSTGLFVGTLVAFLLGTLLTVPYYSAAGVGNFLLPVWYMIGGFVVAGLVLVPTRDLPSILVMPAAAIAAVLGMVVAFFVVPQVAQSLLYSAIYFKRTSIYETIAEAHPADFSTIAFGIGPLPFFLAVIGWFTLAFTIRRHPGRPILFALVWGAIALYFANTAVRFLFNAIPVFCVFAGYYTSWLIDWLDFGAVRKSLAANRGNFWQGWRKGVRPLHYISVVLVVLLFLLPNAILATDAALPPKAEEEMRRSNSSFVSGFAEKRLGAYGQGFIPDYWVESLTWLDQRDAGVPPAQRGAFLSWWDYGHWAIAVGNHPAVADNFQNGYEFAANFLLSQNETHAVQLLAARLAERPDANARAALEAAGSRDPDGDLARLRAYQPLDLTLDQSADLVSRLEAATGKKIRYFATDVRMLPYDDVQTPTFVDAQSIFHAPVRLAGHDQNHFVSTRIQVDRSYAPTSMDGTVSVEEYENLLRNPVRTPQSTGQRLDYKETFFNTMYYRAHVGAPVDGPFPVRGDAFAQALNRAQPGFGLQHFRIVYAGQPVAVDQQGSAATYSVVILEYFPGAVIEGTVTEEGTPMSGLTVTAYDDAGPLLLEHYRPEYREQFEDAFNVPHGSATTDASGAYRVVAPFGNVTLVVTTPDGQEVARVSQEVSREAANARQRFEQHVTLQKGNVDGLVFEDLDGDGVRNATTESIVPGLALAVGGRAATTGEDGNFTVSGVSAGRQNVTVESDRYEVAPGSAQVAVRPGETVTREIALQRKGATLNGTLYVDANNTGAMEPGSAASFVSVTFQPDANSTGAAPATAFTQGDGTFTVKLRPGTYTVSATTTRDGVTYDLRSVTVTAEAGQQIDREFGMTAAGDAPAPTTG